MKRLIILGCTGSIGRSALDVVSSFPDRLQVVGLSAHANAEGLKDAGRRFGATRLCLSSASVADPAIPLGGPEGLRRLIRETDADIVLNAIAGAAGLVSSLDALESGKDLALANKETMVCAGPLVRRTADTAGKLILPVDSEHSAVFNLIGAHGADSIAEIVLTASGGPFWDLPAARFPELTPSDALKHPTWSMGRKITIDSASMANKGLEVIEAHELFGLGYGAIKVVIHRESRVHSLVRTKDGSLYAQISKPDMRLPIQNALLYPELEPSPFASLDLAGESLSFFAPDPERFPLLDIAYWAGAAGGKAPLAYNAANEVAVNAFLGGRIRFTDIADVVSSCLERDWGTAAASLEEAVEADSAVRASAASHAEKAAARIAP